MRFISKISYFWREIKNAKIMKKIGLFILVLFCTSLAFSQTTTTPAPAPTPLPQTAPVNQKVRLGLSFSPLLSWFSTSGDAGAVEPDGTRFNIAFGLNTDFRIAQNSNYYFSTGLFLLNTGGTLRHDYFTENDNGEYFKTERTSDFRINYVNIPVTMMLRTNEIGYIRYFGRVGFDAAFNTKSTYDYTDVNLDNPSAADLTVEDEDASDLTSLMRFGLRIEAGFEMQIGGTTNLYFTATYNSGLNNVFSDDYELPKTNSLGELIPGEGGEPQTERRVKATTNLFAITAGVYF
jgi:hypothetical protein